MTDQEPIDIAVEQELEQESPVESSEEELEGAEPQEEVSELERLQEELAQAQAKADEYLDGWQRARAEFANYRRREELWRKQLGDTLKGQVLSDLLPVMDDLDRAFQAVPGDVCETAWVKGLSMVGDKLQSFLQKAGVATMTLRPGDVFDPNYHQAVFHGPSAEYGEGQIVEVFQRGYTLGETVLRPAMVYVSSGVPDAPCATEVASVEQDSTADDESIVGDNGATGDGSAG
jgi:molecular chaperone GrpE